MKIKTLDLVISAILFCVYPNTFSQTIDSYLSPNQRLNKGDYLLSPNGEYKLIMQQDGNLVLYRLSDGTPIYSMAKNGSFALMQTDSNFVEYASEWVPLWSTNTGGAPQQYIAILRDDGSFSLSSLLPVINIYWTTGPDKNKPTTETGNIKTDVSGLGPPPPIPSLPYLPSFTTPAGDYNN